ncbi:MAG: autotransporter domain-containing protein [Nitrospinales bacterium]
MYRPGLSIKLFSIVFALITLILAHQSMATDFGPADQLTFTAADSPIVDGLDGQDPVTPPLTLTLESGVVVTSPGIGVNFNAFDYTLLNQGSITGDTRGVSADGDGTVNNENSIIGLNGHGVFILFEGFVTNDVAGAIIDGQNGDGVNIDSGTVRNGGLASMITGSTNGVYIFSNGTVFNSGQNAEITGDGGDGVNLGANANAGGSVFNSGPGAKITGSANGVSIDGGGTVSNTGDGATIEGLAGNGVIIVNGVAAVTNGLGATIIGNTAPAIETGTSNDIVTNNGTLTSDQEGIMTRAGEDTITVSGTVTSGGGINAISAGNDEDVVNLEDGATINGDIGGGQDNGSDTINLTGTGVFSHRIKAFQQMNVDNGFWTLDGAENHDIAETDINAGGTLFLDGVASVLDGNATVLDGGRLMGTGEVTGALATKGSGIVAPGASIGTMFADSLDMSSGGNLEIEFDNAGNSDLLEITNGADLTNGTVTFLPTEAGFSGTQTYQFIDSTSGTALVGFGTFDTVISPLFTATLMADFVGPGDVGVEISRPNTFPQLANTANRLPIAQYLEDNLPTATGDLADIIIAISGLLTLDEFHNALDQLGPDALASIPRIRFQGHRNFKESLVQRMGALRFGNDLSKNKGGVAQIALANVDPAYLSHMVTGGTRTGSTADRSTWNPFFKAIGAVSDLDTQDDHFGFESSTAGIIIGLDKKINSNLTVGGAGGYTSTDTDFDNFDTQANMDTFNLAVFGEYAVSNFHIDTVLSYAHSSMGMDREIMIGSYNSTAISSHSSNEFLAHAGAGYDFNVAGWLMGPIGLVEYATVIEDGFTETNAGAANLMLSGRTTHSFRSVAGVRVARQIQLKSMLLVPEAHGRWTHEWLDNSHTIQAQFINIPSAAFNITNRKLSDDGGNLGASLTAYKNEMAFNISYNTEFRGELLSHAFDVGLKLNF